MIRVTFNSAQYTDLDRDGMDVIFYYHIDNHTESKIHAVSSTPWYKLNDDQRKEHAEAMFAGVLKYLKSYWEESKELPPDGTIIQETGEFQVIKSERIEWLGYKLDLI